MREGVLGSGHGGQIGVYNGSLVDTIYLLVFPVIAPLSVICQDRVSTFISHLAGATGSYDRPLSAIYCPLVVRGHALCWVVIRSTGKDYTLDEAIRNKRRPSVDVILVQDYIVVLVMCD